MRRIEDPPQDWYALYRADAEARGVTPGHRVICDPKPQGWLTYNLAYDFAWLCTHGFTMPWFYHPGEVEERIRDFGGSLRRIDLVPKNSAFVELREAYRHDTRYLMSPRALRLELALVSTYVAALFGLVLVLAVINH